MEKFYHEFEEIFKKHGLIASGDAKRVSIATFHIRKKHLARMLRKLRKGGLVRKEGDQLVAVVRYKLASPRNLRPKHVQAIIDDCVARGLSVAYVHNLLSLLRLFCSWIGKAGMVKSTDKEISDQRYHRRAQAATRDKSWSGCGIDVNEKLALITKSDPCVAMVLELMCVFSLRLKEASLLRPWLADQSVYLDVCRGTKGGRDRTHVICTLEHRNLIERAKAMVEDMNACLIPRQVSYRSFQNHVHYVLRKHGITHKSVGTSTHGLRHQGLNDLYEEIADAPSPVRGGQPGDVKSEIDRFARQQVAEVAGHGRRRASSAYLGAVLRAKKKGGGASNPPATAGITPPNESIKHEDVDCIPTCSGELKDEK